MSELLRSQVSSDTTYIFFLFFILITLLVYVSKGMDMTIACTRCGATCEGDLILPPLAFGFKHESGCGMGVGPLAVIPSARKSEKPKVETPKIETPKVEDIKVEVEETEKPKLSRSERRKQKETTF